MSSPSKTHAMMASLAHDLDVALNGQAHLAKPDVGFALLVFDFDGESGSGPGSYVNYVSNANRDDMIAAIREWLARAEGRVAQTPVTRQ